MLRISTAVRGELLHDLRGGLDAVELLHGHVHHGHVRLVRARPARTASRPELGLGHDHQVAMAFQDAAGAPGAAAYGRRPEECGSDIRLRLRADIGWVCRRVISANGIWRKTRVPRPGAESMMSGAADASRALAHPHQADAVAVARHVSLSVQFEPAPVVRAPPSPVSSPGTLPRWPGARARPTACFSQLFSASCTTR